MKWKGAVGVAVGLLLVVAIGVVVHEALSPPPAASKRDGSSPLTDVARGKTPPIVLPLEPPPTAAASQTLAQPPRVIEPEDMPDPSRPPQWTAPLAEPGPPSPPDPFTPPAIEVDPDRGRRLDAAP